MALRDRVPESRIRVVREQPPRADAAFVLYWMRATRRAEHNFALDRAIAWSRELALPLVVLEPLRCDYPWAADRHHSFVIDGMADNQKAFERAPILYHPYVEPSVGHGKGLLAALAQRAAVVITDLHPSFHYPHMLAAAAAQIDARLEAVDSCGLLPLAATERNFTTAHAFRRFLQKELPKHFDDAPRVDPLRGLELPELARLPAAITKRWPAAELDRDRAAWLAELPLDHAPAVTELRGGARAGTARAKAFVGGKLAGYGEGHNHPDDDGASGLSPYLHFGHVSPHAVLRAIAAQHDWTPQQVAKKPTGSREGWWGLPPGAESFLDELVTWRELGHNHAATRDDLEDYASLPTWARATLAKHADDERPSIYDREQLESAQTHDEVWNAAQRQLVQDGTMHNYLRMLWGKKVLQWSATPEQAADVLVELNNRWAIDGRDPNSYSGIYWVFGRYDRPWGPEREIFGTVRYMSSESTVRKLRLKRWLQRYAGSEPAHDERQRKRGR